MKASTGLLTLAACAVLLTPTAGAQGAEVSMPMPAAMPAPATLGPTPGQPSLVPAPGPDSSQPSAGLENLPPESRPTENRPPADPPADPSAEQSPADSLLDRALPLPRWSLATPQQWQRTAKVGEPVDVQLRFASPPEVTITFPCELSEPPSIKVTPLREGGEEEPQWLTLQPVWGAPVCSGGTLTIMGGQRAQYRADLNGLPAGEYRLSGFWFGGRVSDTLGAPRQVLRLE